MNCLSVEEKSSEDEKGKVSMTIDEFATAYPLYHDSTLITFKIYLDLLIQEEFESLEVVDGEEYGIESYCFVAKKEELCRVLVPLPYDREVDLAWIKRCALHCKGKNRELYTCFVNEDSIM